MHIDRTLPFELLVLEAVLASGCRSLEHETGDLEAATIPSLERLTVRSSSREIMGETLLLLERIGLCRTL